MGRFMMSVPLQSRKKCYCGFHHLSKAQPLIRPCGEQSQLVPPLGILFGPFYWLSHHSAWFEQGPNKQAVLETVQEAVAHYPFGAPLP